MDKLRANLIENKLYEVDALGLLSLVGVCQKYLEDLRVLIFLHRLLS